MNVPTVQNLNVQGKKVLVRADLDVTQKEDYRLEALVPTLKLLLENGAKVVLLGHRGRLEGKVVEELKIEPVAQRLKKILGREGVEVLENLRFDPGEEANDSEYAKSLA